MNGDCERGADVQPLVLVDPGDRAVRLQVRVLAAVRRVGPLVDDVRLGEASLDVADTAVDVDQDVALRVADEGVLAPVVDHRRAGPHRLLGVEDGRQDLVLDRDLAAPFLGGGLGLGHHGGHPLPDEADDVVEHVGVVGIDAEVLVDGGGVELARHVLPGEDRMHARHLERGALVDRDDAGVGVRRAEHLQVQHPLHRGVEGVAGLAGDDLGTGGSADAGTRPPCRADRPRRCARRGSRPRWRGSRCSGRGCP